MQGTRKARELDIIDRYRRTGLFSVCATYTLFCGPLSPHL